ncbi:DUF6415 family natural product biosynthesis protein [Streptomyces sp. NPDC007083]|uniref:DUF6415 family natural product biosynthesis protein n=1 Tax=Streptomyces sp. NPDC007083 TaxID=3156913 RepID=UPI0033D2697A
MSNDRAMRRRADVNTEDVKATISTALAERSALPRYEELCCLHEALLKHIEALMPLAAKQIDGLWHGSREWYLKRSTLDAIPYEVAEGLGPGLLTATAHVKSLGYTLRFLFENSGLAATGKAPAVVSSPPSVDG